MIANLISDTVTKPSAAMLEAMMRAEVGDDVFREDPTVNALETKAADLFGMEAALFCPSGTMTNQIAIKAHTQPLDEVICDNLSHIYRAEVGGYAFHSGVSVALLAGENGLLTAEQVTSAIKPVFDWLPRSRLVVLENTANMAGGGYYDLAEIRRIRAVCDAHGLSLHLDGARIFNALVETGETPREFGEVFDSISICLSKGLGAPVGSLLLGQRAFITQARRIRKVMGGGMRQAGFLAAAGIFALDNNVHRLKEDHRRAAEIATTLWGISFVTNIRPVKTNIIIFDVEAPQTALGFVEQLRQRGVLASAFGPQTIRMVTHLDVSAAQLAHVCEVLRGF